MSYSGIISVRTDVDGLELHAPIEKQVTGRTAFGPAVIHLRAGEVARNVTVGRPLPTQPESAPSHFLIATDSPGVRYRIATGEGSPTCRANGLLVTGTEDVFQGTGSAPYWAEGQWYNGAGAEQCQIDAVTGEQISYGGDSWSSVGDGTVQQACFVWGPDDYVDLGRVNDGKQFRFWIKVSSIDEAKINFGCFPYTTDSTDESVEGLVTTSTAVVVGNALLLDKFSYDFSSQLVADKWCHVVIDKSDFSASAGATWSRIVQMRITNNAAGATISGSSIYFGDAPDSLVQSVAIITRNLSDRTALNISLDAPRSSDANVLIMGLVE